MEVKMRKSIQEYVGDNCMCTYRTIDCKIEERKTSIDWIILIPDEGSLGDLVSVTTKKYIRGERHYKE